MGSEFFLFTVDVFISEGGKKERSYRQQFRALTARTRHITFYYLFIDMPADNRLIMQRSGNRTTEWLLIVIESLLNRQSELPIADKCFAHEIEDHVLWVIEAIGAASRELECVSEICICIG
jgi:cytochrome b561